LPLHGHGTDTQRGKTTDGETDRGIASSLNALIHLVTGKHKTMAVMVPRPDSYLLLYSDRLDFKLTSTINMPSLFGRAIDTVKRSKPLSSPSITPRQNRYIPNLLRSYLYLFTKGVARIYNWSRSKSICLYIIKV